MRDSRKIVQYRAEQAVFEQLTLSNFKMWESFNICSIITTSNSDSIGL